MKSYVVCIDTGGDVSAESLAAGVLNRYRGIRIKPDTWVISADETSDTILRYLKDCGAYVFIAEIRGGCRMIQPKPVVAWFRNNHEELF